MTVKELIQQLINTDDMDAEVYITNSSKESEFDAYKSVDCGLDDIFTVWRRGVYLPMKPSDTEGLCGDDCPFKTIEND